MFVLDLRSLALFRILFGFCLSIDIAYRLPWVYDIYSDSGILPREALITKFMNVWESSLFLISGQPLIISALMVLACLSALSLMIGFHTRKAAFLCWILTVSMHTRNSVVLHGGDDVFRMLLFWIQFVPISTCFSVDSYLNKTKVSDYSHFSWGGAGLLLQFMYVYFFSGLLKIHPVWLSEGTGVYYALSLEQFSSTLGQKLIPYFFLTRILSNATFVLEVFGPLLVLAPLPWRHRRTVLAFVFMSFHFGLVLGMELGMFPWLCMGVWTMVLPPSFWEYISKKWRFAPLFKISYYFQSWKLSAPSPMFSHGPILRGIAIVYIALITTWNIYELDALKLKKPVSLRWVMSVSELYQRWSMFAPYPRKDDGWYLIEAKLFNGDKIDPFQDDHKSLFEKPKDVAASYKNSMWRKYLTNSWLEKFYDYRLYFGRYLCRKWNTQQPSKDTKINTLYIHYMLEMTPPPGTTTPEIKQEMLWRHYCYDKPEGWVD